MMIGVVNWKSQEERLSPMGIDT